MIKAYPLIYVVAFICLTANVLSQVTNTVNGGSGSLNEADLRKALADTCDQVNDYYKTEHFSVPAPSPALCSFIFRQNLDYKQVVAFFGQNEKAQLSAEVLATSGRTISFTNVAAFDAAYGANVPMYSKPPPAKWTEAHAIEVAAKFADIFAKPWGAKLGKPYAFFKWPYGDLDAKTNAPVTKQGQWTIKWRRETQSGIPFGTDGVQVDLSEQYGPCLIGVFFRAQYNGEDDHVTPIAKGKALIEARKGLDKILASKVATGWVPGAKPEGDPDIGLYIVCPNDLLNDKSMTDAAFNGEGKGRLAWVATYTVASPSNPSVSDHISVYIDAKDGSFLGGVL